MIYSDVEVLRRAHQLFVGNSWHPTLDAGTAPHRGLLQRTAPQPQSGAWRLPTRGGRQPATTFLGGPHGRRGRRGHRRRTPGSSRGRSAHQGRPRRGPCRCDAYPDDADGAARGRAPPSGPTAHATGPRLVGPLAGATALRGAPGAALPHDAPSRSRFAAAVVQRPRRNRGACRVVASGTPIRLGRDGSRRVRLFRVGPMVVCASGCPPRPHHLSADKRRDTGVPLAGPAGRSRIPARRTRAAGHRHQSGRRGSVFGCFGANQSAGQQRCGAPAAVTRNDRPLTRARRRG